MKSKWSITIIVAAVLLVFALVGASWGGALAQTVPQEPQTVGGQSAFLGGQGVYTSSGFDGLSITHCDPWNRSLFLRQPICLEFNPEGVYTYVIFSLNDAEMEMMDAGELCMAHVSPWQTYPLSYSTTPGWVYAYVPAFGGQYGLAECP
jgi:hypothetical protein